MVAAASTLLALAVRLYWVFRVQSPYEVVYSDMNGYVERARALLAGSTSSFPRMAALYPYGAHYVYAAIFGVLGYDNPRDVCIMQAFLCAIPAYFFVLFAARFFKNAAAPGLLGLLFAVWQPIIWCTGFFLSEVPYLPLLFLNAWLCLRFVENKHGGFLLGLSGAVLFAIRPQFILTFGLLGLVQLWSDRRVIFRRRTLLRYAQIALPWVAVLAFSMGRFHRLTGHYGLISENGQLNRVFADTTIGRVEGRWLAPNGDIWTFNVEPPCKPRMNEMEVVRIAAYMGDGELLNSIRRSHLEGKSTWWRIHRALDNVRLLWDKNDPWPEHDRARGRGMRAFSQRWFNEAARWVLIPLACLGVFVLRRRAAMIVVLAHLLTLVILSMFFLAEARYRVPYDPFLFVLASAGTWRYGQLVRGWLSRRRIARLSESPEIEARAEP